MSRRRANAEALISSLIAMLVDAVMVYWGMRAAFWIRFQSGINVHIPFIDEAVPTPLFMEQRYAWLAVIVFTTTLGVCKLYQRPRVGRFEDTIPRTVKAVLYGILPYIALTALFRWDPEFPRGAIPFAMATLITFTVLGRYLLYRLEWNLARHMPRFNNILILGTDNVAENVHHALKREAFIRSNIIGHLALNHEENALTEGSILGSLEDLESVVEKHHIHQIILSDISIPHEKMIELINYCERNLIRFNLVPDIFRILTSDVQVQNIYGVPLMGLKSWPLDFPWNRARKRFFDIAGAITGLILGSPFMAVAAVLIVRHDGFPIFFKQERLGEEGEPFYIIKMRTMRKDAEKFSQWTQENDPRVTPAGRYLRKWNIDELPQFWNVLRGDMSLVGPRPEQPAFVEEFKETFDRYMIRHNYKPGITGWAQVNGLRGDTSIRERIKYDLYYLENWALSFDFKIIIKTITARKNAY